MSDIIIRNITKQDRDMICQIAFETAFLGSSGATILDDKNLFFDVGILYFLLFEQRNSFVAVENGLIIGYILSTYKIHFYLLINSCIIIPFVLLPKLLFFRYRIKGKTLKFFFYLFLESFLQRIPRASIKKYPGELHINLSEQARGKGIASLLMQKLMDAFAFDHVPGIQLNTTTENKAAIKLYERFGFSLYQKKPSYLWEKLCRHPVDNVTFVREVLALN
jgi:ribosomal protein S18 acetylase RimI-like enzyme